MNVEIVNGRIVDPASAYDAQGGIYIANGRIAGIGRAPDGFRADRTLDARGAVVAPGLVDLCARLREPGIGRRAEGRDARCAGRRGHGRRLPTGYRPAIGRAGAGAHAATALA